MFTLFLLSFFVYVASSENFLIPASGNNRFVYFLCFSAVIVNAFSKKYGLFCWLLVCFYIFFKILRSSYKHPKVLAYFCLSLFAISPVLGSFYWLSKQDLSPLLYFKTSSFLLYIPYVFVINCYIASVIKQQNKKYTLLFLINIVAFLVCIKTLLSEYLM
jgi:hypothetical protein